MEVKFEESGTPLKRSKNRHGETCEEQLRRMVRNVADGITGGKSASDWFDDGNDIYSIRYLVDHKKRFLGAEVMVAGGGPTIWVNLDTKYVEGYWGGDRVQWAFRDNLGLDEYCEEMYGCS